MRFQALSLVAPGGTWIREGRKTIEVRSWRPDPLVLTDLLIVQNRRRLDRATLSSDPDGEALALVDVILVRPWLSGDLSASCSQAWTEGYFAWELANVRPVHCDRPVTARLGIYPVELAPDALRQEP